MGLTGRWSTVDQGVCILRMVRNTYPDGKIKNQNNSGMKKLYSTMMMLATMVAALGLTACGDDDDMDNGKVDSIIVGEWECTNFDLDKNTSGLYVESRINIGDRVRFQSDGTIYARFSDGESETGRWSMRGNALIINGAVRLGDSSSVDVPFEYTITKLTSTELEFYIDLGIVKAYYRFTKISSGDTSDDSPSYINSRNIVGVWEATSIESIYPGATGVGECIYLNTDGTYKDPGYTGHWSLNGTTLTIYYDDGDKTAVHNVLKLTSTEMSLQYNINGESSIIVHFKRKG